MNTCNPVLNTSGASAHTSAPVAPTKAKAPDPRSGAKGVDINHFDGVTSFRLAMNAGISFVFIKATEGCFFTDPAFGRYWSAAGAAGITRGTYHFFRAWEDAGSQADHYLDVLRKAPGGSALVTSVLPPVLDLEDGSIAGPGGKFTGTRVQFILKAQAFLDRLRASMIAAGDTRAPIIYTAPSFAAEWLDGSFGKFPLWLANYNVPTPRVPAPWTDWDFWQPSPGEEGGHMVPGITNSVDVDYYKGSHDDLVKRFGLRG